VVIGDTSFDIAMALNAGSRAIGVAWGYHDTADLVHAGAHAIAGRPSDLTDLLEAA
jgi:phosphoglycolate phosphatase